MPYRPPLYGIFWGQFFCFASIGWGGVVRIVFTIVSKIALEHNCKKISSKNNKCKKMGRREGEGEMKASLAIVEGQAASERATTTVFSSYLQTAAAGADGL